MAVHPRKRICVAVGRVSVPRGAIHVETDLQAAGCEQHLGWAGGTVWRYVDAQVLGTWQLTLWNVELVFAALRSEVKLIQHCLGNCPSIPNIPEILVGAVEPWIAGNVRC